MQLLACSKRWFGGAVSTSRRFRPILPTVLWWLLATMSAGGCLVAAPPNFVVILADDMGFSDIGAYGSRRSDGVSP